MKVLFIAGFGPIASNVGESRRLYEDVLGISFKAEEDDYLHTEQVDGAKTFAVWPLAQAAQSCFGTNQWPPDISRPQAWLEFDVDDIELATRELEQRGYRLLVRNQTEPWGQIVTRLISPEGYLLELRTRPRCADGALFTFLDAYGPRRGPVVLIAAVTRFVTAAPVDACGQGNTIQRVDLG